MEIKLTDREIEALLLAVQTFEDSFEGWSSDEIGKETKQDLKAIARIVAKIATR
jgi:hypothetical protein